MNYPNYRFSLERWFRLTFFEQMANIGSEIERAILWRNKNREYSYRATDRALELLDLTISDIKNIKRLKELARLREAIVDYFYFDNRFSSSDKSWRSYFYAFSYAVRRNN